MNDTEAFLRKIRENPDDDAPRLVFADYLDEQAQSSSGKDAKEQAQWAALIRAQIAQERESYADASFWNKWAGVNQLKVNKLALKILPDSCHKDCYKTTSNGFYDRLRLGFHQLIQRSQELLDSYAPIREFAIKGVHGKWQMLAGNPVLGLIRELNMTNEPALSEEDIRGICSDHQLRSLTGLDLEYIKHEDVVLDALKDNHNFPCLRRLQVPFYDLVRIQELLTQPIASKLEVFGRGQWEIEFGETLSNAPLAKSLTNLGFNDYGKEPPKKIKWGSFQNLQIVELGQNSEKDWVTPFLKSQNWQHLRRIQLGGTTIPTDTLSYFESEANELHLVLMQVPHQTQAKILGSESMCRIKALEIRERLTPSNVEIISNNEAITNLRSLEIRGSSRYTDDNDKIFKMLCNSPVFSNLLHLDMSEQLSYNLLKQLADSAIGQSLRALKCIHFGHVKRCETFLRNPKNFPNLVWLSISAANPKKNQIDNGRKKLKLV